MFQLKFLLIGIFQIFGYTVEGCSGFGATVIASAINAAVLGTAISVPFQCMIGLPCQYYALAKDYKQVARKDLFVILATVIPFLLLGGYLSKYLDEQMTRLVISIVVMTIAIMNIYRYIFRPFVLKKPAVDEDAPDTPLKKAIRFCFLFIGGMVHGAFGNGGPLLTVYILSAVKDKIHFRNTMIAMWAVLNTINVARQGLSGMWSPEVFMCAACALPFTFTGFWLGKKILYKINKEQFLRVIYIILLFIGTTSLINVLKTF